MIRDYAAADAGAVCAIYNHYIAHSLATFEEDAIGAGEIQRRVDQVLADGWPWIVDVDTASGAIRGYAYANILKPRTAYRYCAETTVYVHPDNQRQGVARGLYADLLARLAAIGTRSAIGIITIPNPASIALHEDFGFAQVAHLKAVGYKFEQWADVGFWQKELLEPEP